VHECAAIDGPLVVRCGVMEAFFSSLPFGHLSDDEVELRELLHKTAAAADRLLPSSGAVPIQAWVERRMPRELHLAVNENGLVTIGVRPESEGNGTSESVDALPEGSDEWLQTLPTDRFTEEEIRLREAILGTLEKSHGSRPATMTRIAGDQQVMRAKTFLPHSVKLEHWIDSRIGSEVDLYINDDGQTVCKLYDSKKSKTDTKETFFAGLPNDSFTNEESRMRTAFYDFLAKWKHDSLATLRDAGEDSAVRAARRALLPQFGISLKEYIEQRMGEEFRFSRQRDNDHWTIHLTDAGREALSHHTRRGSVSWKRGGPEAAGVPDSSASQGPEPAPPVEKENASKFLRELPEDRLTDTEVSLRQELIEFLNAWREDVQPTLADATTNPKVGEVRRRCLPKQLTVRSWIDRRIGGEIETLQAPDGSGRVYFGFPGQLDHAAMKRGDLRYEQMRQAKRRRQGSYAP